MTLRTLADLKELLRHFAGRPTGQANLALRSAATRRSGKSDGDPVNVAIALRLVLMLERVACRVRPASEGHQSCSRRIMRTMW